MAALAVEMGQAMYTPFIAMIGFAIMAMLTLALFFKAMHEPSPEPRGLNNGGILVLLVMTVVFSLSAVGSCAYGVISSYT